MKNQLIHLFDKPDQTAAIARAALILCCFLEDDPFCSLGVHCVVARRKKRAAIPRGPWVLRENAWLEDEPRADLQGSREIRSRGYLPER